MKNTLSITFLSLTLLLLSGCGNTATVDETTAAAQPQESQTAEQPVNPEPTPTPAPAPPKPLQLDAKSIGNNQVQFAWTAIGDVNTNGGFVIVRGPQENPTYPNNYYFTQAPERRSRIWINVPSGKQYFRICNLVAGQCDQYSDNIEIEVQ